MSGSSELDLAGYEDHPTIRVYHDKASNRRLIEVLFTALGKDAAERVITTARQKFSGGEHSPEFKADYGLDLDAQPGDMIFPSFGPHNVGRFAVKPGEYPQVLSFDFGFDHPTAILVAQITPVQLQIYMEHYMNRATARVHKERLKQTLWGFPEWQAYLAAASQDPLHRMVGNAIIKKTLEGAGIPPMKAPIKGQLNLFDLFYAAVGDVSGAGYIAEYAEDPHPIRIMPPSSDKGYRDRDANESIFDGLLRKLKRCCFRVWADVDQKCGVCKAELKAVPGVLIDPRCVHLLREIPSQVMTELGQRAKVPDHAVDAALYLSRYALAVRVPKEPPEKRKPWWLKHGESEEDGLRARPYQGNRAIAEFFR